MTSEPYDVKLLSSTLQETDRAELDLCRHKNALAKNLTKLVNCIGVFVLEDILWKFPMPQDI